jgi:hypothetical protein
MLAALIATRSHAPPPPIVFRYSNQLVAATTTFSCLDLVRQAAVLTTSLPVQYQLTYSMPGQESLLDQLNRAYFRLIGQSADDDPNFLSDTIAQTITILGAINSVVLSLPVASFDVSALGILQRRLALAIRVMNSLAIPPGVLAFS